MPEMPERPRCMRAQELQSARDMAQADRFMQRDYALRPIWRGNAMGDQFVN